MRELSKITFHTILTTFYRSLRRKQLLFLRRITNRQMSFFHM